MFVTLRTLALPADRAGQAPQLVDALAEAVRVLPASRSTLVAPVLAGVGLNAGSIVWRTVWESEAAAAQAPLAPAWSAHVAPVLEQGVVTGVGYRVDRTAVGAGGKVWRALVFRVVPAGFPDTAAHLEAGLLSMPRHVRSIRSWALSRVATVEGTKGYTHVWEQEFDALTGLTGEYMDHPVHFGRVDAYFDAESHQYVVDPHLVQVAADIDAPVLVEP